MEAGNWLQLHQWNLNLRQCTSTTVSPLVVRVSLNLQGNYRGSKPNRDWFIDWASNNNDAVRRLPIYVGGVSLLGVLLNRTVTGIAPAADASRVWETLSSATCCRSLIVVYDCCCVLQIGIASESPSVHGESVPVDVSTLIQGSLYQDAVTSAATQSYLANLSLYPGRSQLPFLPNNTQALILQPLGNKGIAIIGGDTIRGFTASDQAWISLIGEKLDSTLSKLDNIPLAEQRYER